MNLIPTVEYLDLEEIFLLPYQKITAYTSYEIFAYYLG